MAWVFSSVVVGKECTSELVNIGDQVDVVVLDINKDKQEISLGMKQTEKNPWEEVEEKYPPETVIEGKVRNLTNYGAFIEIEEGIDGLLHVSDISWTKKVNHPSEVLKKGDVVKAVVLSVDPQKKRVALGMKQLDEDPWRSDIPKRYLVGSEVTGQITKLTNFGAFVELEDNLEGLLHISELSDKKLKSPEEVVSVGQSITCRIIKVDPEERKIGLSLVRIEDAGPEVASAGDEGETADAGADAAASEGAETEASEAGGAEASEAGSAEPSDEGAAEASSDEPTTDAAAPEAEPEADSESEEKKDD